LYWEIFFQEHSAHPYPPVQTCFYGYLRRRSAWVALPESTFSEREQLRIIAVQNRFESTIANLQSASENISAANGRIVVFFSRRAGEYACRFYLEDPAIQCPCQESDSDRSSLTGSGMTHLRDYEKYPYTVCHPLALNPVYTITIKSKSKKNAIADKSANSISLNWGNSPLQYISPDV
jgi:hypothetical protein